MGGDADESWLALGVLGERESGTGKLTEAVAAFRSALEEWTRERVPLDWAMTQMNLGNALFRLGEHESGTGSSQRRSRPIARRWRNGRASAFRSIGLGRR
jgi:Tetratricopeptide repeat